MPRGTFEWLILSLVTVIAVLSIGAPLIRWADRSGSGEQQHVKPAVKTLGRAPSAESRTTRVPAPVPRPRRAVVSIRATRGEAWFSARAGSEGGRVLYEGILPRGRTLRLESRRLWIRFGAASNVDVRIDGRPSPLPLFGTFDAVVDRAGVRHDPRIYAAAAAQSP